MHFWLSLLGDRYYRSMKEMGKDYNYLLHFDLQIILLWYCFDNNINIFLLKLWFSTNNVSSFIAGFMATISSRMEILMCRGQFLHDQLFWSFLQRGHFCQQRTPPRLSWKWAPMSPASPIAEHVTYIIWHQQTIFITVKVRRCQLYFLVDWDGTRQVPHQMFCAQDCIHNWDEDEWSDNYQSKWCIESIVKTRAVFGFSLHASSHYKIE